MDIILLESSLELVPPEIRDHPSVVKNAERQGKDPSHVLLDVSLHYHAMRNLPHKEKRGRPDIVHTALLVTLTDPDFRGNLYIHTLDSKVIRVSREMRPPKNYSRFVGLMEQLLVYGKVPLKDEPLMEITSLSLSDLVRDRGLILLDERGTRVARTALCDRNEFIGIGAFPHGDFSIETKTLSKGSFSISQNVLETQNVLCRLISACIHD
ncbi:Suppressor Mra1 [Metallosphaera sedula]|uniref:Ribosomal RNA small subunit methyltransferase Nep1 n=3 Tax=Metallosphaera TaxID=41980 RepID=A4YES0_METS5|nr:MULTISPECIES: 16S rRNA methyltransferase [Metallosphaera]ABP94922.1 Suppressor Mra1 [Metallosphaera sedula DSM 5348]AIM26909.1 Suppressor Mra1 [Metallosphaera sedula]AKV73842.1 16S rRNA methyltransferase [Metallosphaera sedula]AKV76083.1 16S rRNA methyltransferase [Metallosphaera sedula]AKV78334.1 16S rRNA methyltransferase [Metallosphaera sedula]